MDALFSSGLFGTLAVMFVILFFVFISFFNPFRNKLLNNTYKALMYVMPLFFILPPILWQASDWGYGYADKFESVASNNNFILLFDIKYSTDDADLEQKYLRVHVINKNNGKRICRKMLGESQIFNYLEDNHFITQGTDNIRVWQLPDCKLIHEYSKETLVNLYKEMEVGVDMISFNQLPNFIEISTKDGKKWAIMPITGSIQKNFKPKPINQKPIKNLVKLTNDKFNSKLKYIANEKDTILNKNISFIEGIIAATDYISQHYFIVSYKTTDKLEPILTCMQFNHQILWQIDSKGMNASDYFSESVNINFVEIDGTSVIFNFGGFIYKLRIYDKSVIWKSRL